MTLYICFKTTKIKNRNNKWKKCNENDENICVRFEWNQSKHLIDDIRNEF